jgi:hypothetical protein
MSTIEKLKDILSRAAPVASNIDVIAKWTIPYSEAARIVADGRLPQATIELGQDHSLALDTWQSFWLFAFKYGPPEGNVRLIVSQHPAQAGYEVMMVRERD